jgi:hypothetical protein
VQGEACDEHVRGQEFVRGRAKHWFPDGKSHSKIHGQAKFQEFVVRKPDIVEAI